MENCQNTNIIRTHNSVYMHHFCISQQPASINHRLCKACMYGFVSYPTATGLCYAFFFLLGRIHDV